MQNANRAVRKNGVKSAALFTPPPQTVQGLHFAFCILHFEF